jgi:hypothetical protein
VTELIQRALRTLEASPLGSEIAGFFRRADVQKKLSHAALGGRPPVAAISQDLLEAIPNVNEDPTAKRRIGLLVAALLDSAGFEQDRSGVRITDPLFSTGSTYRRKASRSASGSATGGADEALLGNAEAQTAVNLATRLAETMTRDEAQAVLSVFKIKYPGMF